MFFATLFTVLPICTAVIAGASLDTGIPSPNLVMMAPMRNIATVQTTSGDTDTRLFFQDSTGAILEWNLSGPFTTGKNVGHSILVPANEVLPSGSAALGGREPGLRNPSDRSTLYVQNFPDLCPMFKVF
ncbi:hypothetical protein B0H14DRAFT_3172251, partial [Mycena olivaceomarginata]